MIDEEETEVDDDEEIIEDDPDDVPKSGKRKLMPIELL